MLKLRRGLRNLSLGRWGHAEIKEGSGSGVGMHAYMYSYSVGIKSDFIIPQF